MSAVEAGTLPHEAPKPCGYTRETIERVAKAFANRYHITPDTDLGSVVTEMGGRLEYGEASPDGGTPRCSIEIPAHYPMSPFVIRLDPFPTPEVDRFGIAHELGHFVLHYLDPLAKGKEASSLRADFQVQTESQDELAAEIEADWFAYTFLVSDKDVEEALRDVGNKPEDAITKLVTNCKVPQVVAFERVRPKIGDIT